MERMQSNEIECFFKQSNSREEFIEEVEKHLQQLEKKENTVQNIEKEIDTYVKEILNSYPLSIISKNTLKAKVDEITNQYLKETIGMIKQKIQKEVQEIIDDQNKELSSYRKEGHLYLVEEDVNDRIYLWDVTEASSISFEEVGFPKELKEKATEGSMFLYQNGQYHLYSEKGFERLS